MNFKTLFVLVGICFLLGVMVGGGVVYHFYKPEILTPVYRGVLPEEKNGNGTTLKQEPTQRMFIHDTIPIPKYDTLVRVVRLTVHDTIRDHDTIHITVAGQDTFVVCPPCPEVEIKLAVSNGPNGSRVTAVSSGGTILSGVDIPLMGKPVPVLAPKKKYLGVCGGYDFRSYTPRLGVVVGRKCGPLVLVAQIQNPLKTFAPSADGIIIFNF